MMKKLSKYGIKTYIAATIVLIAIGGGVLALRSGKTPVTSDTGSSNTTSSNVRVRAKKSPKKVNISPSLSGISSSASLTAPNRVTYASDYNPSSKNQTEVSSFLTTPGASCWIEFFMNGSTHKLPSKIADDNGSVVWYWTPGQAELSGGVWKITAIASLDQESKSLADVNTLQIP